MRAGTFDWPAPGFNPRVLFFLLNVPGSFRAKVLPLNGFVVTGLRWMGSWVRLHLRSNEGEGLA